MIGSLFTYDTLLSPEETPMYYICKQIRLIGLVTLYTVAVLMLITPTSPAADEQPPNGAQLEEVSFVCKERYRPEWASQPLGTNFPATGHSTPATLAIRLLLAEEKGMVELQVSAALLTALQTSGRKGTNVELRVPAALLTTLQTEGHVKLP
jgi:hypothetical protein